MDKGLFVEIEAVARQHASKPLIQFTDGEELTYQDIIGKAALFSAALAKFGATPGDRIAIQVEKSVDMVVLYLACLRSGLIYLPMNMAYQESEVAYLLSDAEPVVFICDPSLEAQANSILGEGADFKIVTLSDQEDGSFYEFVDSRGDLPPIATCEADDVAAILYTSGTTGQPKGAMLTHMNLGSNAKVLVDAWGFSEQDVLLHVLPIFHAHGMFVAINTILMSGASMVWMAKFDPDVAIEQLPKTSVLMGVPTIYGRLLGHAGFASAARASNMRLFISGSAPLLAENWHRFYEDTGFPILERYGMTEILMHTSNPLNGDRRAGTVGPTLPGCELRVVGADGEALPVNEIGEMGVKGPNVFKGYWRNPEKTAEEFTPDGWLKTGDLGLVDEQGYIHITGRAKDLIITGGYNVYPKEVELEIDKIDGIEESAVFGVPHSDFGEGVTAAVVLAAGKEISEQVILSAIEDKLAKFKQPKSIVYVSELPRNALGKIQKNSLRDRYADLYN